MCMDAGGGLWVARWGASRVYHFSSSGKLETEVVLQGVENVTWCVFGGELSRETGTGTVPNVSLTK